MLNKRAYIETLEISHVKLVKIVSNKWKNKCFFCRAFFKGKGESYWKPHCNFNTRTICLCEMEYVPFKFIRHLKYAIKTKEDR